MENVIKLSNVEGITTYLKALMTPKGETSDAYVLRTNMSYTECGYHDEKVYIKPKGGPLLVEGKPIPNTDKVVTSIVFERTMGYIIFVQ